VFLLLGKEPHRAQNCRGTLRYARMGLRRSTIGVRDHLPRHARPWAGVLRNLQGSEGISRKARELNIMARAALMAPLEAQTSCTAPLITADNGWHGAARADVTSACCCAHSPLAAFDGPHCSARRPLKGLLSQHWWR
jgi:hypothetical protein